MNAATKNSRTDPGPATSAAPARRKPWWAWGRCSEMPERDLRNMGRLLLTMLLWGVSFTLASLAVGKDWLTDPSLRILAAAVPVLFGGAMVWAYIVFVRHIDELQRKFQLEGLAVGFGAGLIFMTGYRLFERLGAPPIDIDEPLAVMILAYAVGYSLSMRRHA